MKAFLSISCLVVALVTAAWLHGPLQAQQGSAGGDSKTVSFADATDAPAEATTVGSRRRIFGDRDARRLGLTFGSVRTALKELKSAGAIDGTEGNSELAAIVADHIASKNKTAFAAAAIDWDSLLAFLEKLIALIMKLFAI